MSPPNILVTCKRAIPDGGKRTLIKFSLRIIREGESSAVSRWMWMLSVDRKWPYFIRTVLSDSSSELGLSSDWSP